jgi:hypothetical protein
VRCALAGCHNSIRSTGQASAKISGLIVKRAAASTSRHCPLMPSSALMHYCHRLPWRDSSKDQLFSLACLQSCRSDVPFIAPVVYPQQGNPLSTILSYLLFDLFCFPSLFSGKFFLPSYLLTYTNSTRPSRYHLKAPHGCGSK